MTQEVNVTQPTARKGGRLYPIKLVIAGGNEALRGAVKAELAKIPGLEIEFLSEDAVKGSGSGTILTLILDSTNPDGWQREVRRRNFDRRFASVIALLDDDSPVTLRAALRAGADDVIFLPPAPEQAFHTLVRLSELSRRHEGLRDKMVCSLASVSGGIGVSHLAVNLGLALHRLFEKRTALVELDLQAAPLAVMLNQEPEHTISELVDPTSSIDSIRLESVLCKHDSGLYWLAAPGRIEEAELISAATIEAILKVMRELFDFVLIDCGSHITEGSIVVWERSDYLLYLVDQSVTSIRAAQRFLELFERLGLKEVVPRFVLNRYQPSSPITRERIEAALGQPIFTTLPRDEKSCGEQQITGADLWHIRSAANLRESLEELAGKLYRTQKDGDMPAQRNLLSRLLGALGGGRPSKNGNN